MAFYESKGFLYFKNLWIGMGAGLIILGALWKIMHWEYANEIITFAMVFEAAIFFVQAILPPHKEYYWEKLYPGLDNINAKVSPIALTGGGGSGDPVAAKLDQELAKSGVNDGLIKRLGSHLGSLTNNLQGLSSVTSTAGATSDFTKNAQAAANALGKVKVAYENAADVAKDLKVASDNTKKYQEQIQAVSKNLAALNAVYELELQDTNNHLKAMNKFYGHLTSAINNLNESVDDTKKYRQQMGNLSKNLSALNNVYGNMLTAMSMGAKAK